MNTMIINQQKLPKMKGQEGTYQYIMPKEFIDQRQQSSVSELIAQINQYLRTQPKNQVSDLLEKCCIHLKKKRQKNQPQIFGQTQNFNRKHITLGGRLIDCKQLEKQNKNPELKCCSVVIRKVISKNLSRDQSVIGHFNDLTQNNSQVVGLNQIRRISEAQIIEKLKLKVRQKERDISALKANLQTLNQSIKQNVSNHNQNQKSQKVIPIIEIYYPVQIIDPSLKSDKSMKDSEIMQKYNNICQEIDILREELTRREQQGIYLYTILNAEKN